MASQRAQPLVFVNGEVINIKGICERTDGRNRPAQRDCPHTKSTHPTPSPQSQEPRAGRHLGRTAHKGTNNNKQNRPPKRVVHGTV